MEKIIIGIHLSILFAYLTYYFKFSERGQDFFDKAYTLISEIKASMTGEIAEEITKLLKPIPNIVIVNPDGENPTYSEGVPNPAKSENFKNWLDDYLKKHNSFFVRYYQTVKLYKSWNCCWTLLRFLTLGFAIVELILLILTIYFSFICPLKAGPDINSPLFCSITENKNNIFITSFVSAALFLITIILFIFTEVFYLRLRRFKDADVGF